MIDHYLLAIQLTIVMSAGLGLFVLTVYSKRPIIQAYGIYTLDISLWALCWYKMMTAPTETTGLIFCRLLHIPAVCIPLTFLIFVEALLGTRIRALRTVYVLAAIIFIGILPFDFFIRPDYPLNGHPYFFSPGWPYSLYSIYFMSAVVLVLWLLYRRYRDSSGFQRVQAGHILGAYALGYVGGLAIFLRIYSIQAPSWLLYSIPIAHIWIFYAIVRHRLLDIRILIRRTGLLVVIYAALLVALIPALRLMQGLELSGGAQIPIVQIILAGVVLSIGPFIYAYVIRRSTYFHEDTIAGLTHEMKTPLAAIQSALEIIELQSKSKSGELNSDYMNIIRANASRLQGFTESLVQLFGNDGSQVSLNRKPEDMRKIVTKTAEWFRPLVIQKGIVLDLQLPDKPLIAEVDEIKMEQVLSNLLSNALKFTDQGSISVTLANTGNEMVVEVSDTGVGIKADEIPRIFDRFFQGEAGRRKKGTGIALLWRRIGWRRMEGGFGLNLKALIKALMSPLVCRRLSEK